MHRGEIMARKSTIPDEIRKHIPAKCCRIQKTNGSYYVYKYKAIKLPSGKWSNDAGYCIGKINADTGFCPNKRSLKNNMELFSAIL